MAAPTPPGLQLRPPGPQDAAAVLDMLCELDRQTPFMMLEPGERDADPAAFGAWLTALDHGQDCYLVVFDGRRALGFAHAERGRYRRNRHSAYLVLGLLAEVRGQGWGGRLLEAVDAWAAAQGVTRLELTVREDNASAVSLYRRCGFAVEGRRRASLRVDGRFVDELAMAKDSVR